MASVAVIVLQYGNSQATIDCIRSVERYNSYPIKYIIVDNGSPDSESISSISDFIDETFGTSAIKIKDDTPSPFHLPKVTFLQSAVNDGYARGNNKGLKLAYGDTEIDKILILNNDILFVEDIIPRLVNDIDTLDDCALISPILYKKDFENLDPNCARYEGRFRDTLVYNFKFLRTTKRIERATFMPIRPDEGLIAVQLISGSCIMCDKTLFKSIGSFDPGTFLYCEENILWEKIKPLHLRNYIDTDIKAIHLGAGTIKKVFSPRLLKMAFKSQNYFVKTYMRHGRIKLVLLKISEWWVLAAFTVKKRLTRH